MPTNLSFSTSKLEYPGSSNEAQYRAGALQNEATFNAAQQRNQLLLQGMNVLEQRKVANDAKSDVLFKAIEEANLLPDYEGPIQNRLNEYKADIDNFLQYGNRYDSGTFINNISRKLRMDEGINNAIANSATIRTMDNAVATNDKLDQTFKDYYFQIVRNKYFDKPGKLDVKDLYETQLPEKVDVEKAVLDMMRAQFPDVNEGFVKAIFNTDEEAMIKNMGLPDELKVKGQTSITYTGAKQRILDYITNSDTEVGKYMNSLFNATKELNPNDTRTIKEFASSYVNGLDYDQTKTSTPDYLSMAVSRLNAQKTQQANEGIYITTTPTPNQFTRIVAAATKSSDHQQLKLHHAASIADELNSLGDKIPQSTRESISKFVENEDIMGLNALLDNMEASIIPATGLLHAKLSSYVSELQNYKTKMNEVYGEDIDYKLSQAAIVDGKGQPAAINGKVYNNRNVIDLIENIAIQEKKDANLLLSDVNSLLSNLTKVKESNLTNKPLFAELANSSPIFNTLVNNPELATFLQTYYETDNSYSPQYTNYNNRGNSNSNISYDILTGKPLDVNTGQPIEIKYKTAPILSTLSTYSQKYETLQDKLKISQSEPDQSYGVDFKDPLRREDAQKYIYNIIKQYGEYLDKGLDIPESIKIYKSGLATEDIEKEDKFKRVGNRGDAQYENIYPMNGELYYGFRVKVAGESNKFEQDMYYVKIPREELNFAQLSVDGSDQSNQAQRMMFLQSFDELATRATEPVDISQWAIFQGVEPGTSFYKRILSNGDIKYYIGNPNSSNRIEDTSLFGLSNKFYNALLEEKQKQQ